ncbi:MAG: endonuclease/exonuclease/phosphatase family protein [Candidatus Eisenbacteria bacterium]
MPILPVLLVVGVGFALTGCASTHNYTLPDAPRYAGRAIVSRPDPDPEIRVVSFNIEHARRISEATRLLLDAPELRGADIVFLQEMDAAGTESIADSLGMHWVYYPAMVSSGTGRDFGNAILSRWPLRDDQKIVLPHTEFWKWSRRIAVSATADIEGRTVRLYSVHLALPFLVGRSGRRDQIEAILRDVAWHPGPVIIGGDFNAQGVGEPIEDAGFSWPTRGLGHTTKVFAVDHIFARGFEYADAPPSGVVRNGSGASDHSPVWAVFEPVRRVPIAAAPWRFAVRDLTLPIDNAAYLEPGLVRGSWPGDRGLEELHRRGFKTIVNLTGDGGEHGKVRELGLDYFEIPLTATLWSSPPEAAQVEQFLDLLTDPARRPLYFHCKQGKDRTGMMAALYRVEVDRWTNGEAIEEMQAFGYHDWFKDLIQYVRSYVPKRSR